MLLKFDILFLTVQCRESSVWHFDQFNVKCLPAILGSPVQQIASLWVRCKCNQLTGGHLSIYHLSVPCSMVRCKSRLCWH